MGDSNKIYVSVNQTEVKNLILYQNKLNLYGLLPNFNQSAISQCSATYLNLINSYKQLLAADIKGLTDTFIDSNKLISIVTTQNSKTKQTIGMKFNYEFKSFEVGVHQYNNKNNLPIEEVTHLVTNIDFYFLFTYDKQTCLINDFKIITREEFKNNNEKEFKLKSEWNLLSNKFVACIVIIIIAVLLRYLM